VRLTRATFFSFALMLGVFAVWAVAGFGYPSAPVPITLNVVSKLLAFVTVLTLFFPRDRPRPQAPEVDSDEQAQPAGPGHHDVVTEPGLTQRALQHPPGRAAASIHSSSHAY
jgi:hypothetical protein